MLNLSIMSLNKDHIEEICEDIIEQQKTGASTHAMFMMTFNPIGTPAIDRAAEQCKIYDQYKERLDRAGAKHGVLVQATLGHITHPPKPYPFQPSVSLVTGEERDVTCCPLDPDFQKYIKDQMKTLAKRNPSLVMIDDDVGLLYKQTKGCACKYHMAEFNRRAGTDMTREELYAHTQGTSEEDKFYTNIYVETQKYGLVSCVGAMRAGLDEVNPKIQGVVSGIYTTTFCEFSGDVAQAFKGQGNPAIARMNGGPYANSWQGRTFTQAFFRAAILKENVKDKVDIFLAETDTCPQNRYSTSAALMHGHFVADILEGAQGAKHWITRLGKTYEPDSGKAYRRILSKYEHFYEKLVEYVKELKPFGCRIPLTLMQNYGFVPSSQPMNLSPWSTCFLERMGVPLYFSNEEGGAVFLDEFAVDGFSDEEITKMLSGSLYLSGPAVQKLNKRGFTNQMGVMAEEPDDVKISSERVNNNYSALQYEQKKLVPADDKTEWVSPVIMTDPLTGEEENVFPGVTRFENSIGGEIIAYSGTPDMPFRYFTAFSLLNESRKKQLISLLSAKGHIPLYCPGDEEIYMRAGYLNNGDMFAALFNLGFDQLEEITMVSEKEISKIEKLLPDGTKAECKFEKNGNTYTVFENANTLMPVVLILS